MKRHTLRRTQQLYCDAETAWHFFSSPNNLAQITPKSLNFVVLTKLESEEIFEGMLLDYKVTPLLGIALRWQTVIKQVTPNKRFADFQQKGPYKYWNHQHEFIPNEGGVLMKDTIEYELPLGFIGEILHRVVVKKKLQYIFDYRYEKLELLINNKKQPI
ncbi:MAG TPA: SRPBCC family protein [Puia sp.]|jgi:ligand-binding SRPBCC domain-containing protein